MPCQVVRDSKGVEVVTLTTGTSFIHNKVQAAVGNNQFSVNGVAVTGQSIDELLARWLARPTLVRLFGAIYLDAIQVGKPRCIVGGVMWGPEAILHSAPQTCSNIAPLPPPLPPPIAPQPH